MIALFIPPDAMAGQPLKFGNRLYYFLAMRRSLLSIFSASLAVITMSLLFGSCVEKEDVPEKEIEIKKEIEIEKEPDKPVEPSEPNQEEDLSTYRFEFSAIKESGVSADDNSTRALDETVSGETPRILPTFKVGDKVYMYKRGNGYNPISGLYEYNFKEVGVLTAQEEGVETTLVGDVDPELAVFFYANEYGYLQPTEDFELVFSYRHRLTFNYEGQKGTLQDIADNYDYATTYMRTYKEKYVYDDSGNGGWKQILLNIDHENKRITIPDKIRFRSEQSIFKFILKDEEGNPLVPDKLAIATDVYSGPYSYSSDPRAPVKLIKNVNLLTYNNDAGAGKGFRVGTIEVTNSSKSNIVYASLAGNGYGNYWWSSYNDHGDYQETLLAKCDFVLTATVGEDTYVFRKPASYGFIKDWFYVIEVWMSKYTGPLPVVPDEPEPEEEITDPDTEITTEGSRYGQGTVGTLK